MSLSSNLKIGILGAGGKMGMRIGHNLSQVPNQIYYIENAEKGIARLNEKGIKASGIDQVSEVDFLIFAVPDVLIGKISEDIVPKLKSGASVILLDPAAPYMNVVKIRDDLHYTVSHPCHPSLFTYHPTEEAHNERFGGVAGVSGIQDAVAANFSGDHSKFIESLDLVKIIFAPVGKIFEITVEQMAFLEPTVAEVINLALVTVFKEAVEILINEKNIPEEAARSFFFGHLQMALSIFFLNSNPMSDAAIVAMKYGEKIINKNWKDIFKKEELDAVVKKMLNV